MARTSALQHQPGSFEPQGIEHSYKIVDTEKNLGNAIVCIRWLDGQCRKWLRKSMQVAPHDVFHDRLQLAKSRNHRSPRKLAFPHVVC